MTLVAEDHNAAAVLKRPAGFHAELALLVSTYEKPLHLRRVLQSIAIQEGVQDRIEVVVTDDGSRDETRSVVAEFAAQVDFPVAITTHEHQAFQLSRCRNEGVRASTSPYLLFLDGDCILPRDHVRKHLRCRTPGWVMGGYCVRLSQEVSQRIDEQAIRTDRYQHWISPAELRGIRDRHRKAQFYSMLRHPAKPKLAGGNIGIWRSDYEKINGYDERFVGWGGEDDDLRRRLVASGLRIGSILGQTHTYHLWHPPHETKADKHWNAPNSRYLHRRRCLRRCMAGLHPRRLSDLRIRVVGSPTDTEFARRFLARHLSHVQWPGKTSPATPAGLAPEVEILFQPGRGKFSGHADFNVLIEHPLSCRQIPRRLLRKVQYLLSSTPQRGFREYVDQFSHAEIDAFAAALG